MFNINTDDFTVNGMDFSAIKGYKAVDVTGVTIGKTTGEGKKELGKALVISFKKNKKDQSQIIFTSNGQMYFTWGTFEMASKLIESEFEEGA